MCCGFIIKRFINTPVPSNTFVLSKKGISSCIVIDPGSKEETEMIDYVKINNLRIDYILLTHEHFDHCWGVNEIIDRFDAKVVCTKKCAESVIQPTNYFNKFYFNSEESYNVKNVDLTIGELNYCMNWYGNSIRFIETKGHSPGSMCISMGNYLFTGDTLLLNTKPVLLKRLGSSKADFIDSLSKIFSFFSGDTMVFPGHGDTFCLQESYQYYKSYFGNNVV